jgi:hypothetical protein
MAKSSDKFIPSRAIVENRDNAQNYGDAGFFSANCEPFHNSVREGLPTIRPEDAGRERRFYVQHRWRLSVGS